MSAHPPFPLIKVTLDHMRQEIVHAFTSYQLEAQTNLDEALKRELAAFDFEGEVRAVARIEMEAMVKSVVHDAVWSLQDEPEFKEQMRKAVKKHINKNTK